MRAIAPDVLLTPRLRGERLREDHTSELAALSLDPGVYRTL